MSDLIDRQAAIELVKDVCDAIMSGCKRHYDSEVGDEVYDDILEVDAILRCNKGIRNALRDMPSAQPEITLESAIDYLHSIGWMQEHDGILTESAQPEIIRCKDCKHTLKENNGALVCCLTKMVGTTDPNWFCADGERKEQ